MCIYFQNEPRVYCLLPRPSFSSFGDLLPFTWDWKDRWWASCPKAACRELRVAMVSRNPCSHLRIEPLTCSQSSRLFVALGCVPVCVCDHVKYETWMTEVASVTRDPSHSSRFENAQKHSVTRARSNVLAFVSTPQIRALILPLSSIPSNLPAAHAFLDWLWSDLLFRTKSVCVTPKSFFWIWQWHKWIPNKDFVCLLKAFYPFTQSWLSLSHNMNVE